MNMSPTMPAPPLVTIIVASYNYGAYLTEALSSALAQTHRPLEIIVIDDGSTDDSVEIANRFVPDVRVIVQENRGLVAVLNRGIAEARGEYVCVLSADDIFRPTYVERLLKSLLDHPDAGFAYSAMQCFGAQDDLLPALPFSPALLLAGNTINGCGLLRTADARAVGGYEPTLEGPAYEDWDFWLRMLEHGKPGVALDEPLLLWRKHQATSRTPVTRDDRLLGARNMRRLHPSLYGRRPAPVRWLLLKAAILAHLLRSPRMLRLLDRLWGYDARGTDRNQS